MFEDLIPELQPFARALVTAAGAAGLQPRVTSTLRTHSAQVRLYRRWLSGLSPLPAAPPGQSAHEYGYAFDLVVSPWSALADVGYTWETWGGVWGRDADPVHFQFPGFVPPAPAEETPGSPGLLTQLISFLTPSQAIDVISSTGGTQHQIDLANQYLSKTGRFTPRPFSFSNLFKP